MNRSAQVLAGKALWSVEVGDCIEWMNALPEQCVDLVFGSPPYAEARTYGIDACYGCEEWVEWMLKVTEAAQRISRGPVMWVVAGVTRDRNYWPACEGLLWEWWRRGGDHQLYRPCCWLKEDENGGGTGIPGSGGDDYLRADWEYVLCFKRPGKLIGSNNTAEGTVPVCAAVGGEMSNRNADGRRINDGLNSREVRRSWGKSAVPATSKFPPGHNADGTQASHASRPMPKIANPGNAIQADFTKEEVEFFETSDIVRARVGGGHMGDKYCHEGEAPFPEALARFFVRTFCPEGGIVCDPFNGTGTTCKVSFEWGRKFIGCDLRQSQIDITKKRMSGLIVFEPPAQDDGVKDEPEQTLFGA